MLASFIIRTKNESEGLQKLLAALLKQTIEDFEVIVVDSGSTDNTLEIAKQYGCNIITIRPEIFTFGYALNIGITAAQAPIAVLISAHCLPTETTYLENLLFPFQDPQTIGVFGRQIPFQTASPAERRGLKEAYPTEPRAHRSASGRFSNAHAAISVAAWRNVPFDEYLTGAEDIWWVEQTKKSGVIYYQPNSVVYHSHTETLTQTYRRSYRETLALKQIKSPLYKKHSAVGMCFRMLRSSFLDYLNLLAQPTSILYCMYWFIMIIPYRITMYYGIYEATK